MSSASVFARTYFVSSIRHAAEIASAGVVPAILGHGVAVAVQISHSSRTVDRQVIRADSDMCAKFSMSIVHNEVVVVLEVVPYTP